MTSTVMPIRPIRTDQEHRAAVARIEALIGAQPDTPEGDELDVLATLVDATLVDAYEAKRYPVDAPDPVTAIQFWMEQQQLTRKDLEPLIGSRARVSEVLTGKRALTLQMVRRVKAGLGISADLLITPTPNRIRSTARTRSAKPLKSTVGVRAKAPAGR